MPNRPTILNCSVNQSELLRIYHFHQLQVPNIAGPPLKVAVSKPELSQGGFVDLALLVLHKR